MLKVFFLIKDTIKKDQSVQITKKKKKLNLQRSRFVKIYPIFPFSPFLAELTRIYPRKLSNTVYLLWAGGRRRQQQQQQLVQPPSAVIFFKVILVFLPNSLTLHVDALLHHQLLLLLHFCSFILDEVYRE